MEAVEGVALGFSRSFSERGSAPFSAPASAGAPTTGNLRFMDRLYEVRRED